MERAGAFHGLSLTLHCLSTTFHRLSLAFHRLSTTSHPPCVTALSPQDYTIYGETKAFELSIDKNGETLVRQQHIKEQAGGFLALKQRLSSVRQQHIKQRQALLALALKQQCRWPSQPPSAISRPSHTKR